MSKLICGFNVGSQPDDPGTNISKEKIVQILSWLDSIVFNFLL